MAIGKHEVIDVDEMEDGQSQKASSSHGSSPPLVIETSRPPLLSQRHSLLRNDHHHHQQQQQQHHHNTNGSYPGTRRSRRLSAAESVANSRAVHSLEHGKGQGAAAAEMDLNDDTRRTQQEPESPLLPNLENQRIKEDCRNTTKSITANNSNSSSNTSDASLLLPSSSPLPPLPPSSPPPTVHSQSSRRNNVKDEEYHDMVESGSGEKGRAGVGGGGRGRVVSAESAKDTDNDVEMLDSDAYKQPTSELSDNKHDIINGNSEGNSMKPPFASTTTPLSEVLNPKSKSAATKSEDSSLSASQASNSTTTTTTNKPASSTSAEKPQSSRPKPVKRRSPSLEPPPKRPPKLQTIRLEITLGGPDNYEVDITQLAKETGQRPPTPPPIKRDTSSSEDEGDDEGDGAGPSEPHKHKPAGKRKRKNQQAEYYDLNDPFIDDSELAIDERTYIAQTKQSGFYVSAGDVALLKDKSDKGDRKGGASTLDVPGSPAKKPKSKKLVPTIIPLGGGVTSLSVTKPAAPKPEVDHAPESISAPARSSQTRSKPQAQAQTHGNGTRETPIALSDTEDILLLSGVPHTSASESPTALLPAPDMWDTSMSIPASASHAQSPNATSTNGLKRKSSSNAENHNTNTNGSSTKKKRRTVGIESFKPELQEALYELKAAIEKESFEQKGKFPPSLKPMLTNVALLAIRLGDYNETFFDLMPKLFVYNRFTMKKLIKRIVHAGHQKLLTERQDDLLAELKKQADEGFERAKEEYEKNVQAWERRQEKAKAGLPGGTSVEGTPVPQGSETPTASDAVLQPPAMAASNSGSASGDAMVMDVDGDANNPPPSQGQMYTMTDLERESAAADSGVTSSVGGQTGTQGAPGSTQGQGQGQGPLHSSAHMPTQRYRLTDEMKDIIWELVAYSNESVRLENEKNSLENVNVQVSEQGSRKALYQKIVAAFPEGWMSSGQISREVSVLKKRYEAQQAEAQSAQSTS